jgi:serine/threonine protein phosphatase PrpC
MEDSYIIAHDLGLDGALKASLFGVVDGHGGEWCAEFLQREMV